MSQISIIVTFPFSLGLPGGGPVDCIETVRSLVGSGARVTLLCVAARQHDTFPRRPLTPELIGAERYDALRDYGVEIVSVAPDWLHYRRDGRSVRQVVAEKLAAERVDAVMSYWQEGRYLSTLLKSAGVAHAIIAAGSYGVWLDDDAANRPAAHIGFSAEGMKNAAKKYALWPYQDFLRKPWKRIKADRLLGRNYRCADLVFSRSEFAGEEVVRYFGVDSSRVHTAYCGVDPVFFEAVRRRRDQVNRFLFFGAFVREKGVFDAIEACRQLGDKGGEEFRLQLAGWGDVDGVQRAIETAGLSGKVEILGRLDRPQLIEAMEKADVAILPSYGESFGLAAAEAQATGLPVIAYGVAALPEVVLDGETGSLVSVGRTDQLADGLRRMMADPETTARMGARGREHVRDNFDWQRSADLMLAELDSARR